MTPPFEHLLIALDGSSLAEVALPVASAFARSNESDLTLLHVVEQDAPATIHGDRHLQTKAEAASYLEALADRLRQDGITVHSIVEVAGSEGVAAAIMAAAGALGSSLVVLATHGHGGIRDLLFGRVAQKVVQRATRPLLIVPAPAQRTAFECNTMVLPLDGSEAAEITLPVTRAMAEFFSCRVVLIRVVPTPGTLQGAEAAVGTLLPGATATLLRFEVDEAGHYLQQAAARWFPNQDVSIEVRRGQVGTEIEQALSRYQADLVVMSTHGRAGLTAFLEGSIGQHILSRAACPIVLLRIPEPRPPTPAHDPAA